MTGHPGIVPALGNLNVRTTFLDLPYEIRQQIYQHIIPVCRLSPFPYLDPEWSMKPPPNHHRGVHPLMFVSRQLFSETAPMIYSRAILEIAPVQAGYPIFATSTGDSTIPYSYTRLSNQFRFYRADHLKLIQRAHIFSNQGDIIDSTSYDCMLQWLIMHTSIKEIELSIRSMTRIAGKVTFDLPEWRSVFYDDKSTKNIRTIRIWTYAKQRPWEFEKIMRMRSRTGDGAMSPMQIYFWSAGNDLSRNLQLDPRWNTRHNEVEYEILGYVSRMIDEVMMRVLQGNELDDYRSNSRHFDGNRWVYQIILMSERVRLLDGPPVSPKQLLR